MMRTILSLLAFCVVLIILLGSVVTIGTGLWLKTYKAFTKEKLVAVVDAEELQTDDDGNPYFKIKYTPVKTESALTEILVKDDEEAKIEEQVEKREEYYIHGDRFVVEAEVINFADWANLLGIETVYKMTRISGQYKDIELEKNAKRSAYELEGGADPVWETLEYNQEKLSPVVDGVYGSAVIQSARNNEKTWGIYMTEDGLIMKSYQR
jgi:hypothetical protein